ncbi:MAG TPA: response regulator [Planctomycetota bacterium]|nr:response regulator [Planctomycetota bacterium]
MIRIVIADDNPADIELLLLAFSESDLVATIDTAPDELAALELIDRIRPDLVLLDVKMPKIGGLQVLDAIRSRSELRHVPVIIMSSSKAEQDIQRATSLGALHYWQKGSAFSETRAFIQSLPRLVPALHASQGHAPSASPNHHP